MYKINIQKIAICLIGFGVFFTISSLGLFLFKTTKIDIDYSINSGIFANYGTLIGGIVGTIFSLASILLILKNLYDQEINFLKQQVENRFFQLVQIQRENSNNINIKKRNGKKIFLSLLREFYHCLEIIEILNRQHQLTELEKIDLAYFAFFYGAVGSISKQILKNTILKKYPESFGDIYFKLFKNRQKHNKERKFFDYKTFEGHQSRLGHYFRHLFQTVNYIDNQPFSLLKWKDKYQYIQTIRAQLSTQEQVLLFFHSLSDLGKVWEQKPKQLKHYDKMLITKYNLLNNIPKGYIKNIDVDRYYPYLLSYEGDDE